MMEKTRTKLNTLLQLIAKETGKPADLVTAKAILKSIMHGMRDSLSIDTSIEVLTVLPPYLKEVFIEDWKPSKSPLNDLSFEETFIRIHYYYSINSFPPASKEIIIHHYKKVKDLLEAIILPSNNQLIKRALPEVSENQCKINTIAA